MTFHVPMNQTGAFKEAKIRGYNEGLQLAAQRFHLLIDIAVICVGLWLIGQGLERMTEYDNVGGLMRLVGRTGVGICLVIMFMLRGGISPVG